MVGVTVFVFTLMRVIPGDVAILILAGPEGTADFTEEQYRELRSDLGLDKPLYQQYGTWIADMAQGDWGTSLRTRTSIGDEIGTRLPLTFEIALLTLVTSMIIGIPLGVIMAVRQDGMVDYVARLVSIGGIAIPNFWLGTLILLAMVIWLNWLPPLLYVHFWDDPWTNLKQVIWPCVTLGYLYSAIIARMTRSALLEVLRQDYVRTAWAKGLPERAVVVRHALGNALLPIVTLMGLQLSGLLSGTVIVETIWNMPGVGRSLVDAIRFRDYPMVQALIVLFALFTLTANLLVDLSYAWLDPRVRLAGK